MKVMGVTIPGAFSGADDNLFSGLRSQGQLAGFVGGDLPRIHRGLFLLSTFSPNKQQWYHAWRTKMAKTPRAFRARTSVVERQLVRRQGEFDIVLQVGGFFAPYRAEFVKPVSLFCDYTTKLAERNYTPWFGVPAQDVSEWYEIETKLYRKSAMIFTASDNTRRSMISDYGVSPQRVQTIWEGVQYLPLPRERLPTHPTILMVGIDFQRKGGPTLLSAFDIVKNEIPEAELVIVGPAPQLPQAGVTWAGHVSDRRRAEQLFSQATVFAMPSICEPFGLAIIEAMSHALPVVGSTIDAMPELVEEGTTGFLVNPGDVQTLAERLIRLLRDPELSIRMGQAGVSRVAEKFMWAQVVQRLSDGLVRILEG